LWNYPDREDPAGTLSIFPDHFAGRLLAVSALAGLIGRTRGTVQGIHAEVAQVEAVVGVQADLLAAEAVAPGSVHPMGSRNERGAPWGMYPCAGEQQWVAITCRDDADWTHLVDAMASPAWAADPSYARTSGRLARQDELDRRIGEWTSGLTKGEVARLCQAAGVPAGPMLTGSDQMGDPHFVAHGYVVEIDQPGVGRMALEGAAFKATAMVGPDIRPAPMLGEHTRQLARDVLGLDDAEIDRLLDGGVLETTPPVPRR
jgi:crotonobetainyl-CoA:carnitine CoA-transferase CaiB-like acyl-CoA transferase